MDTAEAVTTTINETIDASVFDRWRNDATYRPKSLVDWAKRRSVDPAMVKESVRADDPKVVVATVASRYEKTELLSIDLSFNKFP